MSALSSFKICMAAFLSLLQELVLTHTGIARTRRPQVRTYLHLCHCKVHPLTRCERGRPSRSSAAAHFSVGGVPSIWVLCARASYTTPTSGRCCFHFSSPSFQTHTAPSSTSDPRPHGPGQVGAVFPFRERSTSSAQAQAPAGGKGLALGPR